MFLHTYIIRRKKGGYKLGNLENIYVFNIRNRQSDFALCLKFISIIERKGIYSFESEINEIISNININIVFSKFNRSIGMKNKNKVEWIENSISNNETIKKFNVNDFAKSLKNISNNNITRYYYFRIHTNNKHDDVVNLFYYELMKQINWFPRTKTIAFIVPGCDNLETTNFSNNYRFASSKTINETNQYGRFSDFCSMLSEGNIFSVWCNSNGKKIYSNLISNNRTNGVSKTFIPLFVVDQKSYEEIISKKIEFHIDSELSENELNNLLDHSTNISKLNGLQKYFVRFSNSKIIATFASKIKSKNKKKILLKSMFEVISDNSGISYLQYLLLSLQLFSNTSFSDRIINEIKNCQNDEDLSIIKNIFNSMLIDLFDFSDAVSQLMENIINHSINHYGLATARLIKATSGEKSIQFFIADANDSADIIETFISNNDKCPDYLSKNRENIVVSDMLNSLSNKTYWDDRKDIFNLFNKYRTEFPQYCHGLTKFANAINALNGKAIYCSSCYYKCSQNNLWKTEPNNKETLYVIPGTQIKFEFVENEPKNNLNQVKKVHHPVYSEFATYLDCPKVTKSIIPVANEFYTQSEKDSLINQYFNQWKSINDNSKSLSLCVDFSKFNYSSTHFEVLLKGLVKFLFERKNELQKNGTNSKVPRIKHFAFTNITLDMLTIFNSTILIQNEKLDISNIAMQLTCGLFINLNNYDPYESILSNLSNEIFPFQLINYSNSKSEFEKSIDEYANNNLIHARGENHGYCLKNTHMRLGNKVHLEKFYELSILFKKQDIAIQMAYILCRQLLEMDVIRYNDHDNKKLIIYGYEAYSKSIVFCMKEIIKKYYELFDSEIEVEFVLYQVDRSMGLKTTREKPYFSKQDLENNTRELNSYSWVLLVPISTTLTTFYKMWNKMFSTYGIEENKVKAKLTAFWVVDGEKEIDEQGFFYPKEIEKKYWFKADKNNKKIYVNDSNDSIFRYFIFKSSKWNNPIQCPKCFPSNAIDETPLLETDPSSTVPEQQFYIKSKNKNDIEPDSIEFDSTNDKRILKLKDCISYGHIDRNGNHYQYYFNLPKYFQVVKKEIEDWLIYIKDSIPEIKNKKIVIVSPQQNTDIEFSLYVCNYLCDGNAITLAIDTNRHFRSNIEAEYDDIKEDILKTKKENCFFIYVDTAINSGQGFNRIRSLMSNIVYEKPKFFSFDAIVLLTNRLSNSSKQQFLDSNKNNYFFSFVDIRIPRIRTFGDSCICCKLEDDYEILYKTSATKEISCHYECKMIKNLAVDFNKYEENNLETEGFLRLTISHLITQLLSNIQHNIGDERMLKTKYFKIIQYLIGSCMNFNSQKNIVENAIKQLPGEESEKRLFAINNAIKVLSRPFYTYDYYEKSVIMDFLIVLSETFLDIYYIEGNKIMLYNGINIEQSIIKVLKSTSKKYLIDNKDKIVNIVVSIQNLFKDASQMCKFMCDCIFESLSTLSSNYLLRLDTISKIYDFLYNSEISVYEPFFNNFLIIIVAGIKHSNDSTKSIRLEKELTKDYIKHDELKHIWSLKNYKNKYEEHFVERFVNPLIIENTSVIFKELYNIKENAIVKFDKENSKKFKELIDFLEISQKADNTYLLVEKLSEFYAHVSITNCGSEFFTKLKKIILDIIQVVNEKQTTASINILSNKCQANSPYYNNFYGITNDDFNESTIEQISKKISNNDSLEKFGYSLKKDIIDNKYEILICFENNRKGICEFFKGNKISTFREKVNKKIDIDPVYLYLSFNCENSDYHKCLMIIRYILTFRHSIISIIEQNFSNNLMQEKFNASIAARLLTVDKAGTHMSHSEFLALQFYLRLTNQDIDYVSLKKNPEITEWLLLYNYTNRRIARLYNKMLSAKYLMQESDLIHGQDEVYVCGDILPQYALNNFAQLLVSEDGSRTEYLKIISKVIDFRINNQTVLSIDDFINKVININFIHFNLEDTLEFKHMNMYYSAENFIVCCFLDFCYSTIKNSCDLLEYNLSGDSGIWGLYDALLGDKKKFRIDIHTDYSKDYVFEDKRYGYLILKNSNSKKPINKSGMSLDTIKWYFETLWLLYFEDYCKKENVSKNDRNHKREQLPQVIYGDTEKNDSFVLKLPILNEEDDINE